VFCNIPTVAQAYNLQVTCRELFIVLIHYSKVFYDVIAPKSDVEIKSCSKYDTVGIKCIIFVLTQFTA